MFPFPRLGTSAEELDKPIPSLSSRQFVVPKSKSSPAEEALARARFWLGQEIVERLSGAKRSQSIAQPAETAEGDATAAHVRSIRASKIYNARWIDRTTGRNGQIDLSSLTIADEHLPCLRQEPLSVSLAVSGPSDAPASAGPEASAHPASTQINGRLSSEDEGSSDLPKDRERQRDACSIRGRAEDAERTLHASAETYIDIVGTIRNESACKLRLVYRVIPIASSSKGSSESVSAAQHQSNDPLLANILVTSGSLTGNVSPWPVLPGQQARLEAGVTFLAKGQYSFLVVIEECPTFSSRGAAHDAKGAEAGLAKTPEATAARDALEMRARVSVPFKVVVHQRQDA